MPQRLPAARLSAFYLAYYTALGAFTPYWSLFLKQRGQDAAAISVLMSLWYGTRIVAPSTWNALATRSSRPVAWLRIGCLATLASFLVFLVPMSFTGLFAAMVVFCFCYNAVMPQFEAITLSHLVGRSEQYGRIRVWGSIGFIGSVGLLGLVFDHWSVAHLPLLMLPMFAALLAASFANDYGPGHVETPAGVPGELRRCLLRRCLLRRDVLMFLLVALLAQISFGPLYTFFSIFLEQHGYRASTLGLFWALGVAVEIGVFFLAARLLARFDARHILIAALASAALRWLVTALFPDRTAIVTLAQLTHALNFAAFFAACMQFMAKFFPGRLAGHGQGLYYGLSSGVGGVLGALIAGQAWRIGGGELAFLWASGFAIAATVIAWRYLPSIHAAAPSAPEPAATG